MKAAFAILVAGPMSLGIAATPATAYHLSPSGNFTADGTTSATKGALTLPCKAHFTGKVNSKGVGYVTGATFTDNGALGCAAVTLGGTPYKSIAKTASKVVISKAQFNGPAGLSCGPGNVPVKLKSGVIGFTAVPLPSSGGDCTITGKLTTSPTLSIVP